MASKSSDYFAARTVSTVQEGAILNQSLTASGGVATFTIPLSTIDPTRTELELTDNAATVTDSSSGQPRGFTIELQATQILVTVYGTGPNLSLLNLRWRVSVRAGVRSIQRGKQNVGAINTTTVLPGAWVDPSRVRVRLNGTYRTSGSLPVGYATERHRVTGISGSGISSFNSDGYAGLAWEATEEL